MEINNNGPEKELEAAGEPAADNAPAEQAAPSGETKKKKKKKRFTKKRELTIAALSAALGLTGCFFVPGDTFLANQHEFTVCAARVLLPLIASAVGAAIAIFVFLNVILAINVRLWKICSCLMSGVLIAGYSQIMFMN